MTKRGHRIPAVTGASLAALLLAGPAGAASQGGLGSASRGTITISVSLRAPARVAGVSDLALDRAAPAQELCFAGAARGYTVAASGGSPDGTLTLANGDERLAYRVEWLAAADEAPSAAPPPSTAVRPANCAPGSGRLAIAFEPAAAERLRAGGAYTGALLLTLAPE
jgi:hypothetical protein